MSDDFDSLIDSVTHSQASLRATVPAGRAAQVPPTPEPPPLRGVVQKVNYSHDGMINLILAHRGISQNQIAAHFGYTASWVSQVMASDAFQARLAERAGEIEDPTLRATVEDSLKGLVSRSMEILKQKLQGEASTIPDNLVVRTLELSTRALGYGAREQTVAVQVNVDTHLESLGGRLERLLDRKKLEALPAPDPLKESADAPS